MLVHGIGEKKPGEQTRSFIKGIMHAVHANADKNTDQMVLETDERGHSILVCNETNREVRLYEVHWADLLMPLARGSFNTRMLGHHCWFPWLNRHLKDATGKRHGTRFRERLWSLLLIPIGGILVLVTQAINTIAGGIASVYRDYKMFDGSNGTVDRDFKQRYRFRFSWSRMRTDPGVRNTVVTRLMDDYMGDVFTYVHSLGDAFAREDDPARYGISKRILKTFRIALEEAIEDDCDEIQVLAHSLGTVVTCNSLLGYGPNPGLEPSLTTKLTRVITIGSPLSKIWFFWPKLIPDNPSEPSGGDRTFLIDWVNFYNPLDIVSGKLEKTLQHWKIISKRVWIGGPMRAHLIYEYNRRFLGVITDNLFNSKLQPPFKHLTWIKGVATAVGEVVATILLVAVGLIMGLGFAGLFLGLMLGIFTGLGWLIKIAIDLAGWVTVSQFVKDGSLIMGVGMSVVLMRLFLVLWYRDARNAHKLFNHEEQLKIIDRSIAQKPLDDNLHIQRGEFLVSRGRYLDALASFTEAAHINPHRASIHELRGDMLRKLTPPDYDGALAAFDEALRLDPHLSSVHWSRGLVYRARDQNEEALDAYLQLRNILSDPSFSLIFNISATLFDLGRYEEALREVESVIKKDRKGASREMYMLRGKILMELNRADEAAEAYKHAIDTRLDRSIIGMRESRRMSSTHLDEAYFRLTEALISETRWEDALNACDKALEQGYENTKCHAHRAVILFQLDKYEEALESVSTTLSSDYDWPHGYMLKAAALNELNQPQESLKVFEDVIRLYPDYINVYFFRGCCHHEHGEYEAARLDLEKFLENGIDTSMLSKARECLDEMAK